MSISKVNENLSVNEVNEKVNEKLMKTFHLSVIFKLDRGRSAVGLSTVTSLSTSD